MHEDGSAWHTIHVNHSKPAKLAAPDLPLPTPAPEPPRPTLGYVLRSFQKLRPHHPPPPPQAAALTGGDSPCDIVPANHNAASSPRLSSHLTREMPPPLSVPTNQNSEPAFRPRRSPRLNPELDRVCAIKGPPGALALQSQKPPKMARTYPLFLEYNQCLGVKEEPLSFASVCLEDLRYGQLEYLSTIEQLVDALPKTEDLASRFALSGHITSPGHQRLRRSMRAALWWLLLSDGEFRWASHSLHYYLARQGRRVVFRWGDVARPFYENCLNWVADHAPPASRRLDEMTSPAVPTPLAEVHPWLPGCLRSRRRRRRKANSNSAFRQAALAIPPTWPANDNSSRWASSIATWPRSTANDLPGTQPGTKTIPVKHPCSFTSSPLSQHPIPVANQNAECTSRQDHSEIWGLYKPAQIDPRQDLTATRIRDNISGFGLSSSALQQPLTKPFSGLSSRPQLTSPYREAREAGQEMLGIVYPLMPRAARPDTRLQIDAALPEAAAFDRGTRPPTVLDIVDSSQTEEGPQPGPSQPHRPRSRPSHKRSRNCSTGVYRPKKRSPPRGHWCD